MIRAIAFDLDNTIYDEGLYFLEVFKKFSEYNGINYDLLFQAFSYQLRLNSKDIFSDILISCGIFSRENREYMFKLYTTISVSIPLYKDAEILLDVLKKNKNKLAIITNGVISNCLGIFSVFDIIIYARHWGREFEKPHPISFNYCLEQLELTANQVLFIGDNLHTDVIGAKTAGLKTVLIKRSIHINREHCADYEVSQLTEVSNIIKGIL